MFRLDGREVEREGEEEEQQQNNIALRPALAGWLISQTLQESGGLGDRSSGPDMCPKASSEPASMANAYRNVLQNLYGKILLFICLAGFGSRLRVRRANVQQKIRK